ncbi:MAG: VWD domain-containing protein [Pseudomonadota bacterium]
MSDIQYNTAETLLANTRADVNALMGGPEAEYATSDGGSGGDNGLADILEDLTKLLQRLIDKLGGDEGGSTGGPGHPGCWHGGGSDEVIAGSGRIWGDPHFIGEDGGKFDVQGRDGGIYNLLSDQNFQMNGRFDAWGGGGATVVGQVGISAGSDQIEVNKDGTVLVNGEEVGVGERVELADGGYVHNCGNEVTVESGEWKVDFQIKQSSRGNYINMDVSTENANSDGVKPHGLLGQTFDADDDARNGAKGRGAQGEGAIDGVVTDYEVDGLYDRNFTDFNQFFDDAEGGGYDAELTEMMAKAFGLMAQSMFLLMGQQNQAA